MSEYSPQSSLLPPQEEEYPPLSHANRILYTPHQQTHTPDDGDDDGNSSMNYILKFSRRRIFYLPTHTHAHIYSIIALETKKHKIFPLATFFTFSYLQFESRPPLLETPTPHRRLCAYPFISVIYLVQSTISARHPPRRRTHKMHSEVTRPSSLSSALIISHLGSTILHQLSRMSPRRLYKL